MRLSNAHGQRSWGWFDENKLLVSHNGGPCDWPICPFVWDAHVKTANELCEGLNNGLITFDLVPRDCEKNVSPHFKV